MTTSADLGRTSCAALFAAAGVRPADRVLDVGCGAGDATRTAARPASHGYAVGIDVSARLLRRAQRLTAAELIHNATYLEADARVHVLPPCAYDVIVGQGGVTSCADPPAAFRNLARALLPGGRLAFVCSRPAGGVRAALEGWDGVEIMPLTSETRSRTGLWLVTANRPRRAPAARPSRTRAR